MNSIMPGRLGVGILGSGFVARFHAQSWVGVRNADIVAIAGRNDATVEALAGECRDLGVGEPATYSSHIDLVRDPSVDAIWVLTPNAYRVQFIEEMCEEVSSGRATLTAMAIEKPLATSARGARQIVDALEGAGIIGGYLENQVFAPGLTRGHDIIWRRGASLTGSPFLSRCAEEHSGPHRAWFWDPRQQGGGVLSDMMCHSLEAGRMLLTPPGASKRDWLTPLWVSARIASLKWSRGHYPDKLLAEYGEDVDYRRHPAEDYASVSIAYRNGDGEEVISEATTSWSYVGPGLRLSFELLGPEYSMQMNTLETPVKVFLGRDIQGEVGEDLVEKQNAEQGWMPLIENEALTYGYTDENRHMVKAFSESIEPNESVLDGLTITELTMAAYRSAEIRETVDVATADLEDFVPMVSKGEWRP